MLPSRVFPKYQKLLNGIAQLKWPKPPRNVFVVKKDFDDRVIDATRSMIAYIRTKYDLNVFVEPTSKEILGLEDLSVINASILENHVDFVVTLGGDGTILHAASLYKNNRISVPPILSFSLGTLGFLLPFDISEAKSAFDKVYTSKSRVINRSRLCISPPSSESQGEMFAMNDLTIHRGSAPHLSYLDISVNGDPVTTAIADGIVVATPTGSTAYSLSSGGSIVHPSVPCILVTPICPRSLSFRPLIFPIDSKLSISVSSMARGAAELSLDGQSVGKLNYGDTVALEIQDNDGVWCVTQDSDDWVQNLNELLGFNSKFGAPHER